MATIHQEFCPLTGTTSKDTVTIKAPKPKFTRGDSVTLQVGGIGTIFQRVLWHIMRKEWAYTLDDCNELYYERELTLVKPTPLLEIRRVCRDKVNLAGAAAYKLEKLLRQTEMETELLARKLSEHVPNINELRRALQVDASKLI